MSGLTIDTSFLRRLRVAGIVEGISTLALFGIAMPLKYLAGMPSAVTVVGSIHGVLFLILVALFVVGRWRIPLTTGLMLIGIAAAVVPFGPFVVDRQLERVARR